MLKLYTEYQGVITSDNIREIYAAEKLKRYDANKSTLYNLAYHLICATADKYVIDASLLYTNKLIEERITRIIETHDVRLWFTDYLPFSFRDIKFPVILNDVEYNSFEELKLSDAFLLNPHLQFKLNELTHKGYNKENVVASLKPILPFNYGAIIKILGTNLSPSKIEFLYELAETQFIYDFYLLLARGASVEHVKAMINRNKEDNTC